VRKPRLGIGHEWLGIREPSGHQQFCGDADALDPGALVLVIMEPGACEAGVCAFVN
jgi:hypothetical protein